MFKCKWFGCSYKTQSYFGLKRNDQKCSLNSVAKTGSAKVPNSTSFAAMTLQGAASRTEGERVARDVSVAGHVVLTDLGIEKRPRKRALQPSDGRMITDIAVFLRDEAESGGKKSLNKVVKLMQENLFDATESQELVCHMSDCKCL